MAVPFLKTRRGRKGTFVLKVVFKNVLVGGVNMLFKCVCRVVYSKSKCGSRGWKRWYGHFLNGVDSPNKARKAAKITVEKVALVKMPEVHWRQKPNFKQYRAGDWSIWSWPASLQEIVFFLSKYFFACVRIWRHIANLNSEPERYSCILTAKCCKYFES